MVADDESLPASFRAPLRPSGIKVHIGYTHPLDEGVHEWAPVYMSWREAYRTLRSAKKRGLTVERGQDGFSIAGAFNPAWSYQ
jgi:hypothetical protein